MGAPASAPYKLCANSQTARVKRDSQMSRIRLKLGAALVLPQRCVASHLCDGHHPM